MSRFSVRGPHAVVAHHPLGAHRVVGHDLLEQVGPAVELGLEVLHQHLAHELADLADRTAVALPRRVDPHRFQRAVAHPPEDGEAVELAVAGHVAVQPAQALGHRLVILGRRRQPRRRALRDHQIGGDLGNVRQELQRAGAGADADDPLARERQLGAPLRRVHRLAGERAEALDLGGELRPVELADGADHDVGGHRLARAGGVGVAHRPGLVGVAPHRLLHGAARLHVTRTSK